MDTEPKGIQPPDVQKKPKYEPGKEYFSPHRPPGKLPEGYSWVITKKHKTKGYSIGWTPQSTDPEPPDMDTLPPIDEKGNVLKVSQPLLIDPKKD